MTMGRHRCSQHKTSTTGRGGRSPQCAMGNHVCNFELMGIHAYKSHVVKLQPQYPTMEQRRMDRYSEGYFKRYPVNQTKRYPK
jgi:hypothetical protein